MPNCVLTFTRGLYLIDRWVINENKWKHWEFKRKDYKKTQYIFYKFVKLRVFYS